MNKFFQTLPFNASKLFVHAKDKSGCVIIVPVAFDSDLPRVRKQLVTILENQPKPHIFNFPPKTPNVA